MCFLYSDETFAYQQTYSVEISDFLENIIKMVSFMKKEYLFSILG